MSNFLENVKPIIGVFALLIVIVWCAWEGIGKTIIDIWRWSGMTLVVTLWWRHIANQYKAGRTEKFHIFKIVWQRISPGACMPREWSRKPARHFILVLFGEHIIEVFRSDLGLSVHIWCKSIFSYHINQYKKTKRIDLFGHRYEWKWRREIVPPIERQQNV